MKIKQVILFVIILLLSSLIYLFRSVPTGQLWDNYTVFYVPQNVEDEKVIEAFDANGIKDFISLAGQEIPIKLEEGSMADMMFKLNLSNYDSEYLERRSAYFFDSTKNYRIYYIPNKFKERIEKTVKTLDSMGINAGVDSSVAFPWALPVIVGIAVLLILLFVKNKKMFFLGMLVPVFFVYCNPFYSSTAAVLLIVPVLVVISNLWGRDGALEKIFSKPGNWIVYILAFVAAFASSWITGLLFGAALVCQYLFILMFIIAKKYEVSRQTYTFINIKPLKMFSAYAGKAKIIFPVLLISIAGVLGTYRVYSTSNIKSHFSKILLPGSSETHNEEFPVLDEYYKWSWNIISFPMRSLNLNYDENPYEIVYPRYVKEKDGIKQVNEVFKYDDAFCKTIYNGIDDLGFNNIEHVIKSQGNDFMCGFTTAKNYHVSIFSILMIGICFLMLFIEFIMAVIKKGGKK